MQAKGMRIALGFVFLVNAASAIAESSRAVLDTFSDPPREYSSAPLWVWNDMLTEDEVLATLRDLAAQDVKQVFVHPRPGLMTPYLSKDWFRLWKAVLREAEVLDMNVWIYDENSYPSGFAGGFVPEAMPESHGLGLVLNATTKPTAWDDKTLAVYRLANDKIENISDAVRSGTEQPEGNYIVAATIESKSSPWFGGKYYVDLLRPGVTEKFLEITLGAYKREIGDQFGKRVPGSFTDEPHLAPAGGLHWTPDLPDVMQRAYGYSILDSLPSLTQPVGDWRAVRHDYYQTLLRLFIERWAKPYHDYCAANNLEFTGHYWEHEWPNCKSAPDNMAMYAWSQRPAIDTLFNEYDEGPHAQFGNVRAVIELASAANQSGAKRTLCEAYGGGGWDLRFEDMKRIGDWLLALGVTTLDQHLSFITMRGARKYDYPQSFSYHEPWWDSYHVMAKYFTRLSAALSHGAPAAETLLIEPTTTAWMYQTDADRPHLDEIGSTFQKLVTDLAKAQVEFDLGSEDIIARQGSVEGSNLRVGKQVYKRVLIAPHTESLDAKTAELLDAFVKAKGELLCVGERELKFVDGRPSEKAEALIANAAKTSSGEFIKLWTGDGARSPRVTIDPESGNATVYHMRRQFDDGDLVFLINTRNDAHAKGSIAAAAPSVQQWKLATGTVGPYLPANDEGKGRVTFDLPPSGSLLLFLSKSAGPAGEGPVALKPVPATGAMEIARVAPNVLTLDYLDLKIGEKTYPKQYMYAAARLAFQSVGLPEDPWDHAVQFNDELIRMEFPKDSGFEATYRFTIEKKISGALYAVVERPDLYTIACNGETLAAVPGEWWLDRAFGKIDITKAVREGANAITLKASPMTMYHEIAAVYILGDFAVTPAKSGHTIVPSTPVQLGAWNAQGYPFYAQGVSYKQRFNVSGPAAQYRVSLPAWYGSVAKVLVNGELAGHIAWQPAECDVTKFIKAGDNEVEVIVVGTLKNTLGPYFGKLRLGFASPESFRNAPADGPPEGTEYKSVGYGLMEPFRLMESER
jgi:hypothetical protein